MTGRHYAWHRRWVVDLAACTATHDSGLVLRASRAPDAEATDFNVENLNTWQAGMLDRMPLPDVLVHAKRLLREGVQVYQRAQDRRH